MSKPCRLGILVSGRGSNLRAIASAFADTPAIELALVLSNREDSQGLHWAKASGFATIALIPEIAKAPALRDAEIAAQLQTHQIDLVILAGYERIIGPLVLAAYPQRILNIHPSLLPAYGGKNMVGERVHAAVLANAEKESGCTVHLVTDVIDGGGILGQRRVSVLADDTPETLADRVLAEEHRLFPEVIQNYAVLLSKNAATI